MKLVITASIKKAEFDPIQKTFCIDVIKIAAKKSLEGLGRNIKSSNKIPKTSLSKIYLTSTSGTGRAIFLLKISQRKSILVMIRLKNDKQIGSNITIKNPKFKQLLEKNLDLILKDLENGEYEEYDL